MSISGISIPYPHIFDPFVSGFQCRKVSFIHLFQYLVMRSCTNRQGFLGFKAILSRTLGASCPPILPKRKWCGVKTCSSSGSLLQYVNGREFKVPSTSITAVSSSSSDVLGLTQYRAQGFLCRLDEGFENSSMMGSTGGSNRHLSPSLAACSLIRVRSKVEQVDVILFQ